MNETPDLTDDIPEGFRRHFRQSPLTDPWEPLYSRQTDRAIVIGLRIARPHTNSRGLAHGGLITALADNAMGLSCGLMLSSGKFTESSARLLTASLSIDFVGSATIGQWLSIESDVVKVGSRLCFAQCLIMADGTVCARASASFSVVQQKPEASK